MKTVTVKGKVYQTGEWYLNDQDEACYLIDHSIDGFEVDINGMRYQSQELTVIESVGTITDAPIELEDGEMYSFEFDATRCMGFFNEAHQAFVNCGTFLCFLNEAIMIAPLMERT